MACSNGDFHHSWEDWGEDERHIPGNSNSEFAGMMRLRRIFVCSVCGKEKTKRLSRETK